MLAIAAETALFVLFDVLTGFVGAWAALMAAAAGHAAVIAANLFTRRTRDRVEAAWQRLAFAVGMWCLAVGLSRVLVTLIDGYRLGMVYAVYTYFLPKICAMYLIVVAIISVVLFLRKIYLPREKKMK